MTPQKIHKIFIPPKNINFSENPKKYWNSEFWTPKNGPSLRMCENIRVSPPPPPPWDYVYHFLEKAGDNKQYTSRKLVEIA